MTLPANDNTDPSHHAGIVLRHVLKRKQDARAHYEAGMAYARTKTPEAFEATLALAGSDVVAVARAVLREGKDLTQAGKLVGGYATDIQARAWAKAKLEAALAILVWHPHRIERDTYTARLVERCKVLKAQNDSLIRRVA